ncbi:acyltransferase family protein [Streptomyces spirodelae]|uniref:Acyltransferase family protein n=1 Tax=Streptomyces spirodelae TaxID=2812904 RepID=A0ABS3X3S5_9ACTN|nr:acyltransferase family protein [Streptomyces spirodelae]MBO8190047.1 acyltransferase family protein [Streptomyces spirodelae]
MLQDGYTRAPLPSVRRTSPAPPAERPSAPPAPAKADRPSGRRDPFLDNAKYLTIVLVGVGHLWAPMQGDSRTVSALYATLYAFHMPAFIIISGFLSRSYEGTPRQIKRLVTGVLVPYLAFQTVYTLFMRWLDDPQREFHYQEPGFALWFLVALFVWRLTTPVWKNLRWPMPVALAIAVGASVTPSISSDLDLMRIAQFLPFFVLGLQLRPEHFELVQRRAARRIAVPVTACALLLAYWSVPRMSSDWFLREKSAAEMGVPAWVDATMVLAVFGCGLVLTVCFLAWVPRRHMWFTALGAGTLCAYLLHVYPIKLSRELDWYSLGWVGHPASRVALTVLVAAMMTLLCTSPVRKLFRSLMEPAMPWFFRAGQQAGGAAHGKRPKRDRSVR